MAVFLSPVGGVAAQFFTNSGVILSGGKLYSYTAGTTTPEITYTSSGGSTAHTNPIILNSAGRVPSSGEIWLTDGISYKFVLTDANDVLIATYDNIVGINSTFTNFLANQEIQTATAGQTVFTLANPYVPGANTLSVFVDGVNQYGPSATYAYVETNSNTVTFTSGLHVGASVKFTTVQSLTSTQATTAALVSYTPGGTGAVTTNVQTKLRQYISPEDFGAVANGIANDTTSVSSELANANAWLTTSNGKYLIDATTIASNKYLFGASIVGNTGSSETLKVGASAENVKLIGVDVNSPSGYAVGNSAANARNILVVGSTINADTGYGILSNASASGTDGFVVIGSSVTSGTADAIEWNHSGYDAYNFSVIGNILDAPTGTTTVAGFGVGIAGTQGHITVGNHIRESALEAIHVESVQVRGVVSANTGKTKGEAVRVLNYSGAAPIIYSNNTFTHNGTKTGIKGIRLVVDGNGNLSHNVVANNVMTNFGIGIAPEDEYQIIDGNLLDTCDTAISGAGNHFGTNYAKNCTNLLNLNAISIAGKIISNVNVLVPLTNANGLKPGPYCKGIFMPFAIAHTGSGVQSFTIATLPSRISGKVVITIEGNGTQSVFYAAEFAWDGSTLTTSHVVDQYNGAPSSATLIASGGSLKFQFSSGTAITATGKFDFDGVWYVQA